MSSSDLVFLENIQTDGDAAVTQMRETLDDETVGRYAEAMAGGDQFPLVDLVEDGEGNYLIADGWHRVRAHDRLGRKSIQAVVHSVPDGVEPLDVATKIALRANIKHGLHLTRGDQKRKARVALLHPDYVGWSLRALELEIGVSKSTLGRVRTALIRAGELKHPAFGNEEVPDWVPDDHASVFFLRGEFRDFDQLEKVYEYVRQLKPEGDPKNWAWSLEDEQVVHSGLFADKKVTFSITDNPVVDGLPEAYEEVVNDDGEEELGEIQGRRWDDMTEDERDRMEAARVRKEFNKAVERINARGDRELTRAVNTLKKRADEPGLWEDIRTVVVSGGPAEEHDVPDF